jgi:hypothetical protein
LADEKQAMMAITVGMNFMTMCLITVFALRISR